MLLNLGRRISREGVIEAMWGGAAPCRTVGSHSPEVRVRGGQGHARGNPVGAF